MPNQHTYSNKAALYARYRWDYAAEAIQTILHRAAIGPETVLADIGAGTGILARHFIGQAGHIYAVEINEQMRLEAVELANNPCCTLLPGSAETSGLDSQSIDVISVGQAIHWFEPEPTRREFQRILKPGGWLAVLNNSPTNTELGQATGAILRAENGVDLAGMARPPYNVPMSFYYGSEAFEKYIFPFQLHENWEQFFGGMCSASFMPDRGHPHFSRFEDAAHAVFERFSQNGVLVVHGETALFLGQPE